MCEKCSLGQLQPAAPSRRSLVLLAASALGGLMLADTADAKDTKAPPKPENVLSPDAALKRLRKEMRATLTAHRGATTSSMKGKRWPEVRTRTQPF